MHEPLSTNSLTPSGNGHDSPCTTPLRQLLISSIRSIIEPYEIQIKRLRAELEQYKTMVILSRLDDDDAPSPLSHQQEISLPSPPAPFLSDDTIISLLPPIPDPPAPTPPPTPPVHSEIKPYIDTINSIIIHTRSHHQKSLPLTFLTSLLPSIHDIPSITHHTPPPDNSAADLAAAEDIIAELRAEIETLIPLQQENRALAEKNAFLTVEIERLTRESEDRFREKIRDLSTAASRISELEQQLALLESTIAAQNEKNKKRKPRNTSSPDPSLPPPADPIPIVETLHPASLEDIHAAFTQATLHPDLPHLLAFHSAVDATLSHHEAIALFREKIALSYTSPLAPSLCVLLAIAYHHIGKISQSEYFAASPLILTDSLASSLIQAIDTPPGIFD